MVRARSRVTPAVTTEGKGDEFPAVKTETGGRERAGEEGGDIGALDELVVAGKVVEIAKEIVLGNDGVHFEEERFMTMLE